MRMQATNETEILRMEVTIMAVVVRIETINDGDDGG